MTGDGDRRRSLASRISAPPPLSSEEAERQVDDLVRDPRVDGLSSILAEYPRMRDLLVASFCGSPFLRHLSTVDPIRLRRVAEWSPEELLVHLVADARRSVPSAPDEPTAMRLLRTFRQEAALLIALADLGGVWTPREVMRALTEVADTAVAGAVRLLLGRAASEGRFHPSRPADPGEGSGYVVLAMGKHGAGELNYSSDIDLIVLHDRQVAPLAAGIEAATFFVRITKALVRLLQERTGEGYVFRVDLRLRPDPGSTAVSIDLDAALRYYESMGQNWERAALIKARPVAGDIGLGEMFLRHLQPFIFRKYFDFAAVADVHAMKRQIHSHRGHASIAVEGHNIKLGRGGIREIEFFVQTQQLIAGGRDPRLRGRETLTMLASLAEAGWISADARDDLTRAYLFLRTLEHRLQMVADEQTHTLPSDRTGLECMARLMGFDGLASFTSAATTHLKCVEAHYAKLFERSPSLSSDAGSLVFTGGADDPDTLETIARMGFSNPKQVTETVRAWHFGRYAAMRSEKARERLTELVPALLEALGRTDNPDAALIAFDGFLGRLPAGVQLFSLLRENPTLLRLLADVLGTAPRLSERVVRRAHALDALLEPGFFGRVPDVEELRTRLAASLSDARSYEDALDRARIFADEQKVLIGFRILSGSLPLGQAGRAHTELAETLVSAMHRLVSDEFARSHGRLPGGGSAILALGKLGGEEMTAASDLDLIILYTFGDGAVSDGTRPLVGTAYYQRFAQRLVAALSAPTGEGRIYDVDLRLRPSGRAGPLATHIDGFVHYQHQEAWTWEHMALTRARVVSAEPGLAELAQSAVRDVLLLSRDEDRVRADVAAMRARIARDKGHLDFWDLKLAPGGLLDIEFIAQALQLAHAHADPEILSTNTERALAQAARFGRLGRQAAEALLHACRLQSALTQVLRLCLEGPFDPATASAGLKMHLARAAGLPDFSVLEAHLSESQREVRAIFLELMGVASLEDAEHLAPAAPAR